MGLDVTAHKNVKLAKFQNEDEFWDYMDETDGRGFLAFVITDEWLNRISDLENNKYYTSESSEPMIGYAYSYHSFLRNEVCKMMGVDPDSWAKDRFPKGSDFEEWLNFADNEGCISWTTCKKLYSDFKKWHPKAKELNKDWLGNYEKWMETFEFSSEKGAVEYR